MPKPSKNENVRAGAAGHSGHDRQPAKDRVRKTAAGTPDEKEAASAGEVKERSDQAAAAKKTRHPHPDMAHPGPNRAEAERSKGDAHHDQREPEKEMKAHKL